MGNVTASFYKNAATGYKSIDITVLNIDAAEALLDIAAIVAKNAAYDSEWEKAHDMIWLHIALEKTIQEWREAEKAEKTEVL